MKRFDDVRAERASGGRETLPAGGYVCQIISAKVEPNDWGGNLVIAHDVCEGEYAGIFRRDYESNDREDKKWRGIFRINLPKGDDSQQDAWKKRKLGNAIWAIEQSNPGYTWDWDERTLKGLKIGLIYRNEEWEMNGRTGWTTKAGGADSIDNIRNNKFRPLKDKPLPDRPADSGASYTTAESEADLPF